MVWLESQALVPPPTMSENVMAELPQTYKLSDEEKKYLDTHGFLVIKELIDFSTLYSCKQRFSQICKGVVDKGSMLIVKEPSLIATGATGEDLINKAQDIHYDDVFSLYTESPRLLDVMSQLIGDDLSVMHSMLINKPPGTSRHPPHQDLFYFPFRPTEWIMAAWTAIDHVTRDNGCLYVIPGSHRDNTLYEHGTAPVVGPCARSARIATTILLANPAVKQQCLHCCVSAWRNSNRLYHGILDEEAVAPLHRRVHLEMSPGDTVLFHPLLVHGSGPNVSKVPPSQPIYVPLLGTGLSEQEGLGHSSHAGPVRIGNFARTIESLRRCLWAVVISYHQETLTHLLRYRKAITAHYANSHCRFEEASGQLAHEIEAESKKKGFDISYTDVWLYKRKHVKGVHSKL
ncbi:hypothetical protein MSG28_012882 [Choristoneura fumiferana]|uniref:Uncharacterized protein n=1 Tax=Choristoneura fumiferana TaxID=7141 RepID=A0ACC0JIA1_CHOFU|nr:hypothetical protein MSG28_012882 [Choristoneura fumiferana]